MSQWADELVQRDGWGWRTGFSHLGRDPPEFRPYVPRLLDVAWCGLMAHLKEQRADRQELTRSRRSLLLTRNLAIGNSGEEEPENIQREELALIRRLIMVPRGEYIAR